MRIAALLGGLLVVTACGSSELLEGTGLRGAFGSDGPLGTRVVHEWMRAGPQTRPITLVFPVEDAVTGAMPRRIPGIVLVQGGLVERDRYVWLARHLASRGYAVALPDHVAWLSLLDASVTAAAADHLEARLDGRLTSLVVGGHSLGGVTASNAAMEEERFAGLFLLASEPQDVKDGWNRPVVSIAGDKDESQSVERARTGWDKFGNGWFAEVADLTHFAWTTPGTDPTTLRETEKPSPNLTAARRGGLYVLDAFLASVLDGDSSGASVLNGNATPPVGVKLTSAGTN